MSNHRSSTKRRRRTGRTRAIISLGAVAVLATGMSVKGTFAFWSDSATATTGSFSSGTLDITLNNLLAGPGGTTNIPALTLSLMVPGESVSASFPIANNGTVGLNYTISGSAIGDLAPFMQFTVTSGTANTATGTAAAGNRAGTCSGPALVTNATLTSATQVLMSTPRNLTPAGATKTENICVMARLNPDADDTAQTKTMSSASLVFNAKQVGA